MAPGLPHKITSPEFVEDKTIVILVRDPRDVLISFYYSIGFTHITSANPEIADDLQKLRANLSEAGVPNLWIPKSIRRIEAIPVLASGKLNLARCKELAEAPL